MAVTLSNTDYCCLQIQRSLDAIAGDKAPDRIVEKMGFTEALISPTNTNGFEAVPVDSFAGKARPAAGLKPKVEVVYEKPSCEPANSTLIGLCGDRNVDPDTLGYLEVTVDEFAGLGGQFSKEDFEMICEQPNERLAKQIRKKARDVVRSMNRTLIAKAYSVMGIYSDGDPSIGATAKTVNILNADGFINPAAMSAIKSQYRKMHSDDLPIVVGGDILATWEETRIMGGLGANAIGANVGTQSGGVDMFEDYHLDGVIQGIESDTVSHSLTWLPGAMQLLQWYKYQGAWEELGKPDYTETTIVVDGITFDWSLYYDKCTHEWKYEISKNFDLWWVPDEVYEPCWDFNHKLHFILACGDWSCAAYF